MNSYGSFCGWLVVLAVVGFGVRTVHPQELANSLTAEQVLNNQYDLVFQATPKKKSGLQRVDISTSLADIEIAAADNVTGGQQLSRSVMSSGCSSWSPRIIMINCDRGLDR
jgi:hypothetical protein